MGAPPTGASPLASPRACDWKLEIRKLKMGKNRKWKVQLVNRRDSIYEFLIFIFPVSETEKGKVRLVLNQLVRICEFRISNFYFPISIFRLLNLSAHEADFFRLDFVSDAHVAGLLVRVDGLAKVFLR